jgi:hypothetical protein
MAEQYEGKLSRLYLPKTVRADILEMSRGRFPGFVATAGAALELRPTVV